MTIWNLGSINADHFFDVPHLPQPGETLVARGMSRGLGGKGANMAVASARAGARVELIGAIGPDGHWLRERLAELGVSVTHVAEVAAPSGHAAVAVEPGGENLIILTSGANASVTMRQVEAALSEAQAGDIFVCQNETNLPRESAARAKAAGLRVAYAAAPFSAGAVEAMADLTDLLILNAVEAAQMARATGRQVEDLPIRDVVVTLGAEGCRWIDTASGKVREFASLGVAAVDTTGAGDTFTGYLLAGLDEGLPMEDAIRLGQAAAALKVTRKGTADAIPARDEVMAFASPA